GFRKPVAHRLPVLAALAVVVRVLDRPGRHAADSAVDESQVRVDVGVALDRALETRGRLAGIAHAYRKEDDLAVGGGLAVGGERPDLLRQRHTGRLVRRGTLVLAAAIQPAGVALVHFLAGQLSERFETGAVHFNEWRSAAGALHLHANQK